MFSDLIDRRIDLHYLAGDIRTCHPDFLGLAKKYQVDVVASESGQRGPKITSDSGGKDHPRVDDEARLY
jgi:hypothetical protein